MTDSRTPDSHPARTGVSEGRTEADGICAADGCCKPRGTRLVVLLDPDGRDDTTVGPYCDDETDRLLGDLIPRYSGGNPTYRVQEIP